MGAKRTSGAFMRFVLFHFCAELVAGLFLVSQVLQSRDLLGECVLRVKCPTKCAVRKSVIDPTAPTIKFLSAELEEVESRVTTDFVACSNFKSTKPFESFTR